jgi:site-specific recombinase XerD
VLELQEMLGHEKMETVRIYAKLAEVDLAAAQRRSSVADNWRL